MFNRINTWSELSADEQNMLLQRPALLGDQLVRDQAGEIISAVQQDGDGALFELARKFEGRDLRSLKVSSREFAEAEASLSASAIAAIDTAITNVRRFHAAQLLPNIDMEINPGVRCERRIQAIDSVGLYVPAGSAPLPSAAIMLGVPADIAGCPVRVLCTPADRSGAINAATLVAAQRSGVSHVIRVGGAQAIAAMAYGTKTVPKVAKIFGPGNAWVTAAKSIVASDPAGAAIDMPAGPSEVLVIADKNANPVFVAADLISQAEHGEDSQVLLIATSRTLAESSIREMENQLEALPRKKIAQAALNCSHVILVDDVAAAIDISNRYAPEHLILQIEDPREVLDQIRNAGSVFLGAWTPEAVGDYCSGTNHVLPTYGNARCYSGLGVEQFMRYMTVQELTLEGLNSLAPTVIELAGLEGLDAHAEAVRLRLKMKAAQQAIQ